MRLDKDTMTLLQEKKNLRDALAERDRRIEELEGALKSIRATATTDEMYDIADRALAPPTTEGEK